MKTKPQNPPTPRPNPRAARNGRRAPVFQFHHGPAKSLLAAAAVFAANTALASQITVFAAASLTDALKSIAANYDKQTGDRVVFNFADSATLARQIEAGAPADIFFSADEREADALQKAGLVVPGTRRSRLSNALVVIVPRDGRLRISSPQDLATPAVKRLALGQTQTVPAGIYAREYLQKLKLWSAVKPKVIPTENVRAVLGAVESGNVDAGIVYKTDAAMSSRVKVVFAVPLQDGPKISYPMMLVKGGPHPRAGRKFLDYLASPPAGAVFEKFGFIVLGAPKR